nr:glycosyltransferase [Listeria floridensis]
MGGVQKKQVPTYLSLANITITSFLPKPILATNSPNKFFDALALGKPIIVNSAGWTKDIVVDNEIGFYVDATKPEELANVLASLTNKKEELSGLKSKIRAVAEENFQADILAEKAMKILIQVNERSH